MFLLIFGFFIFVKQGLQDCEPRVNFLGLATAIAEATGFSALGAETGTVRGAEKAHGEGEEKLLGNELAKIQNVIFNDGVFVNVFLNLTFGQIFLCGNGAFQCHRICALNLVQASSAFCSIGNNSRELQAHIARLIGYTSCDARVTRKLCAGRKAGSEGKINVDSGNLASKHRTHIQNHTHYLAFG
jgi:hypothetical protein